MEIVVVLLFSCAIFIPFCNKPFHIDEPDFIAMARQIVVDPRHPLAFSFNMFGRAAPMSELNEHPLTLPYLLAAPLQLSGGREWVLRWCFFPFDLLGALGLYGLASLFLRRPLLPTLIVLASPAYLINMQHLMAEKWIGAFGFVALYALVRGVRERKAIFYWASAICLGIACLFKPSAFFFLGPAVAFQISKKISWKRTFNYAAAAAAPFILYTAIASTLHLDGTARILHHIRIAGVFPWSRWPHRLRSVLAFGAASCVAAGYWPYVLFRSLRSAVAWLCLPVFGCGLLFSSVFDWQPVHPLDRLLGFTLACGMGTILARCFDRSLRKLDGWILWVAWIYCVAFIQGAIYWSVVTRYILFLIPPTIFLWSELFESRWKDRRLIAVQGGTLCIVLALGLALAQVDFEYASAGKRIADFAAKEYVGRGKKVWFTGHWGFQHYMEAAGAEGLDKSKGGWDQVHPGDVVIQPQVNTSGIVPHRRFLADVKYMEIQSAIPLRTIHPDGRQAGFYSSIWGFLPFAISLDPIEVFEIVEMR